MPSDLYTFYADYYPSFRLEGVPMFNFQSNYGVQMVNNGKDDYTGIATGDDKYLYSYTRKDRVWSEPTKLSETYKAAGRVSVTSFEDRMYVAYRGTNNGVYLIYQDESGEWTDLGRVGSKYALTTVSPAISVIGEGSGIDYTQKLVLTGVGEDKYIYFTILSKEGKRDISWTKIPGTGTQSALAMTQILNEEADEDTIMLFHTAYNNGAFFHQTYSPSKKTWSSLQKVAAPNIASGPAVTTDLGNNHVYVCYKGERGHVQGNDWYDKKWSGEKKLVEFPVAYQLGLVSEGSKLLISAPVNYEAARNPVDYKAPPKMDEKQTYISEKEMKEWDVKWQGDKKSKSMIMKAFDFWCC